MYYPTDALVLTVTLRGNSCGEYQLGAPPTSLPMDPWLLKKRTPFLAFAQLRGVVLLSLTNLHLEDNSTSGEKKGM